MIFYYIPNDPAEPLIVVRDAGFEPRTSASEICCATNEPHTSYGTLIFVKSIRVYSLKSFPIFATSKNFFC